MFFTNKGGYEALLCCSIIQFWKLTTCTQLLFSSNRLKLSYLRYLPTFYIIKIITFSNEKNLHLRSLIAAW